jgi:UDP-2,3-diacylglucosamine pyrophosphatase LpxH
VTGAASAGRTEDLTDDTLVVFVSDTHMGGDPGADLFEAHDELSILFVDLGRHDGPVELVLAGDIFDLLRVGEVATGTNRVAVILADPRYADLIAAWRTFAATDGHRVTYLAGNHDVEMWWNPGVRESLQREGLVHEFALSYGARYRSMPGHLIYCEHGNQLDLSNARADYGDPRESPLGDHVVADLMRPIAPRARTTRGIPLGDLPNVYPLTQIPEWLAGRLFYDLLRRAVTLVMLPLLAAFGLAYVLVYVVAAVRGETADASAVQGLFTAIGLAAAVLLVAFVLLFAVVRRALHRSIAFIAPNLAGIDEEAASLARVELLKDRADAVPNRADIAFRDIDVFVWGHSHAPSLTAFHDGSGVPVRVAANSGCWLRQLRPVPAHLGAPPVFVSQFVLTHVRVTRARDGLRAELWEHVRRVTQPLPWIERLAIAGRSDPDPVSPGPRLVTAATIAPKDA